MIIILFLGFVPGVWIAGGLEYGDARLEDGAPDVAASIVILKAKTAFTASIAVQALRKIPMGQNRHWTTLLSTVGFHNSIYRRSYFHNSETTRFTSPSSAS